MQLTTRDGRPYEPQYLDSIDPNLCIGCGRCFKVCGLEVMSLKGYTDEGAFVDLDDDDDDDEEDIEKKVMVVGDGGHCIGCGACARVCPTNAQAHSAAA